ncbi:MAG: glycosyl hydrolase 115 family protein [Mangrovibacterium sp.]|nr:glycosyl hydrolase 115 family protein [Mangrovibacterium sp.]
MDELTGKWELFKYGIFNNVGGKKQVLTIAGSNVRGTIFGIYDFEHKNMGVDPLWFWADNEPPKKGELIFDDRINFSSLKEPTWKYRGWTLNDHPLFMEWMQTGIIQRARYDRYMFAIHPEVFDRLHEAALRLKMNMFTWYFIDADWQPDREQLQRTVDRGLFITQQQAEPLGANYGYWNHYWDNHNPSGKPKIPSYFLYPDKFEEFWSYYIKKWAEFSPNVVWESGFRGWADAAYSDPAFSKGGTPADLAKIVDQALKKQVELIKKHDKNPDLEIMTTLYAEVGMYYDSCWIQLHPDVTTGFADKGLMHSMSYSRKFWEEQRDPNRKYGQYFHTQYFGGGPQIAKCTPIDTYIKPNLDAMFERGDTQHILLAMNTLRQQQLEIRGIAEMLWDYPGFDYRQYLQKYCTEEFGEKVAADVAKLYDSYYEEYPHTTMNNGFIDYPFYYKVMEPMFTVTANLLHIEAGNTDGLVFNYQYDRNMYKKGIKDLGEVLEQAKILRSSIPENRQYFFDYEFIDAIRLVRGVYKLAIATNDAIAYLEKGDRSSALAALNDAEPLTLELYNAFSNQKSTVKWCNWFRSDTNNDFYLLYNLYQKARLHLETESMDIVTAIKPQRRPFRGNVVMHDPVRRGDAIYGAQAERNNNTVRNGSMFSIISSPLKNSFQISGIQSVSGKGKWIELGTDYDQNYSFTLKTRAKIYVACQQDAIPEWLAKDGFHSTGQILEVGYWGWPCRYMNRPPERVYNFEIFAKDFSAGYVSLGKNKDENLSYPTLVPKSSVSDDMHHEKRNLPYIVFVNPSILIYENFRNTDLNEEPKNWKLSENGGNIRVVDIPDYDGEIRPSAFDLTTVPRYTPLDLKGLKLETTSTSLEASTAEYLFKEPTTDEFILDIRFKIGQENHRTGLALITADRSQALEVMMTDDGKIAIQTEKGKEYVVASYLANCWYNIKLTVSAARGTVKVEIQDNNLNVKSSEELNFHNHSAMKGIRLIHSKGKEGSWITYNAFGAYLK